MEKLFNSKTFQEFKRENPDAFFCGGFLVIDKNNKCERNKINLDYYIPSSNKIFSFQLESDKIEPIPLEQIPEQINKISDNIDFVFEEIEEIILNQMKKEGIKKEIQKTLLSLQNIDGKDYIIGTVFITGLGLLKINFDIIENKITEFQKKSFFDMINVFKK